MHTGDTAAVTAALCEAYGLEGVGLHPTRGGYLHRSWRVQTPAGPVLAKLYQGPDWPPDRVAATLQVQQRLAELGHPVPRVWPNRSDALLTPILEPDPNAGPPASLVVMDFAPGAQLQPGPLPPEAAAEAGAVLGRMHAALRPLPTGDAAPLIPDTEAIIAGAEALRRAVLARLVRDETDELALETAAYRIRSARARPVSPAAYEGGVFQVVHGDYYPGNLLFDGARRLTAVIDFDFCGPRWRALEVGRAVAEVARGPGGSLDGKAARAFLRAYQAENPLHPDERRAMFRIWHDYLLGSLYPLDLRYLKGGPLPHGWERLARRRHDLMVWLGDRLDTLEALVRQG